jgi:hypothetical protein
VLDAAGFIVQGKPLVEAEGLGEVPPGGAVVGGGGGDVGEECEGGRLAAPVADLGCQLQCPGGVAPGGGGVPAALAEDGEVMQDLAQVVDVAEAFQLAQRGGEARPCRVVLAVVGVEAAKLETSPSWSLDDAAGA